MAPECPSDRDSLAYLIAVAMPASFDHITWPECLAVATALERGEYLNDQ